MFQNSTNFFICHNILTWFFKKWPKHVLRKLFSKPNASQLITSFNALIIVLRSNHTFPKYMLNFESKHVFYLCSFKKSNCYMAWLPINFQKNNDQNKHIMGSSWHSQIKAYNCWITFCQGWYNWLVFSIKHINISCTKTIFYKENEFLDQMFKPNTLNKIHRFFFPQLKDQGLQKTLSTTQHHFSRNVS